MLKESETTLSKCPFFPPLTFSSRLFAVPTFFFIQTQPRCVRAEWSFKNVHFSPPCFFQFFASKQVLTKVCRGLKHDSTLPIIWHLQDLKKKICLQESNFTGVRKLLQFRAMGLTIYGPWEKGTRVQHKGNDFFFYILIFFLFLFFVFLFSFSFTFISWKLITLQYCSGFCHTLTWISHGFTCIPHPDPPSHLPLHPIPLGPPSAPGTPPYLLQPENCHSLVFPFLTAISSAQFSRSVMSNSLWPHGLPHARPPCPSPTLRVYSNSCPLSQWCHPTISSSVVPFSSCLQSFPASGSFQMTQFFASVAKVLEFQLQHQSLQWTFKTDLL